MMKRLLFLSHCVPYPPDKGERVRALEELKALAPHFRVTLAALHREPVDPLAPAALGHWCERVHLAPVGGAAGLARGALSLATGGSVSEGFFRSRRMAGALQREAAGEPFDLVFAYSSSTLPPALAVPAPRRVMDLVDVDSAKWSSYAVAARPPMRWLYAREARGVRALEERAVERCDAVLLVSEAEKQALGMGGDKVIAVANGVDTERFRPADRPPAEPPTLVFTGQMDYRPNVEGVSWLAREIWPVLRKRCGNLQLVIVGRNPVRAVRALAALPGVTVTGAVPDVRPYLETATAAVAPLKIARGIQNKVLEAMAMALPVVATSPALEGLEVAVGSEVLRADGPGEWADAVLGLCDDARRRQELGRAARQCVAERYSWSARMAPLVDICQRLTSDRAAAVATE